MHTIDTGPGIAPAERAAIFEEYAQAGDTATTPQRHGSRPRHRATSGRHARGRDRARERGGSRLPLHVQAARPSPERGRMSTAAVRLPLRVLRAQLFSGLIALRHLERVRAASSCCSTTAARASGHHFALDDALPSALLSTCSRARAFAGIASCLRSLALGSAAIEPEDIARLSQSPPTSTTIFVGLVASSRGRLSAHAVSSGTARFRHGAEPGLARAHHRRDGRASALCRSERRRGARARARQPRCHGGLLERAEAQTARERSSSGACLLATATPVGFVAVGSSLVTHAHVRKFDAESREHTAEDRGARRARGIAGRRSSRRDEAEAIEAAKDPRIRHATSSEARSRFGLDRDEERRVRSRRPSKRARPTCAFDMTAIRPITLRPTSGLRSSPWRLASALGPGLRSFALERSGAGHRTACEL